MSVSRYIRQRLLKWARQGYNQGKYRTGRRYARITHSLFRDRESLDILARSNLRLKNYKSASRAYNRAVILGYSLLDHEVNHFSSELGSENYLEAFRLLNAIIGESDRAKAESSLVERLSGLTDTERVDIIKKMNEDFPLPIAISELLPWSPKKVQRYENRFNNHSLLSKGAVSTERLQREIGRIRNSGSFRVSEHISSSIRNPLKLIFLPFSIPKLVFSIILERKGKITISDTSRYVSLAPDNSRDCVLFFPTNGVGFGHFTRLLSIAREYKKESPETEIVFFTTMPTLHILANEGFVCYHIPGRYRYDGMDAKSWNALCEEFLSLAITIHRPSIFVFDGSFPYRGMLNSIKNQHRNMLKFWVRRGAIKKDSKGIPVDSIRHFDAIIRPGDSVSDDFSDETRHNVQIVKTNPILLSHGRDSARRQDIRKMMGVPKDAILCYIQLGAGQINDIDSDLSMVLAAIDEYPQAYAIIGESMLGNRLQNGGYRVRSLRDYPNSMYFEGFDFCVIAGGYNSYHEVINSRLPSICLPNLSTGRDDQYSRAKVAADKGAMIVLKNRTKENIRLAVSRLMDPAVRKSMRHNAEKIKTSNGANEVCDFMKSQIE